MMGGEEDVSAEGRARCQRGMEKRRGEWEGRGGKVRVLTHPEGRRAV